MYLKNKQKGKEKKTSNYKSFIIKNSNYSFFFSKNIIYY